MNPTIPTNRIPTIADVQQQVASDHSVAEGLVGSWVSQLSSKQLGRPVHGVTFGYPEILADFQALHARFPDSVLIRSDDYSSYGKPGYWVTVMAKPYASPNAANAWCDANGIPAEDCFAHRLSHTDGPAGSSKTR
jgi:serine/threonine-protein kinase